MKTIWGERLDPAAVLQEYPRPQLRRDSYINLNGSWEYAITEDERRPSRYDGTILVPFSPEAALSGVNRALRPGQTLWYRREVNLTPEPDRRLLVHFGAVDQRARVYWNGTLVCEHVGGYTAFTADVTRLLSPRNELVVQVHDDTERSHLSRGKQSAKPGGIWYTAQSGIWQTVWAEWVTEDYIRSIQITPDVERSRVHWKIDALHPEGINIVVRLNGQVIAEDWTQENGEASTLIRPEHLRLWSPEEPVLYDAQLRTADDVVDTYFAMRSVGVGADENGVPRLLLNGKPYFHNGVLDQGYWPDGLYTAPSDEAMVFDIQQMKQMGFNMLRKHIKCESMRWYYHCDRLGMLVWQDMISGGGRYDPLTVTAPLVTHLHRKDNHYRAFARTDAAAREQFYQELHELLLQLYNCPCIVMWVPFNEGWGQFDAEKVVERIKSVDTSRTIDHASGWHDQKLGQLKSLHVYFVPYRFRKDRLGRAVILSEFGGYSLPVAGHCQREKHFGYRAFRSPQALQDAITALYEQQIIPAKERGLAASVYTQLSDVEGEINGLLSYDRKVVKLSGQAMRELAWRLK